MANDLPLFLEVVKDYTDKGMPLHRAKALKWTGERVADDGRGLNWQESEALWQQVVVKELVSRDQRGNIIGLSETGEALLSKSGTEGK